MRKIAELSAMAVAMLGLSAAAMAGPQMTFGQDDKGVMQLDYKGQFQMSVRDNGSGPTGDDTTTHFNFRRNRLALMGAWGDMFSLYVQTEYVDPTSLNVLGTNAAPTDPQFTMLDAVFRFNFGDAFKLNAGKFKHSLMRENMEACENPLTLDRSLFITTPLLSTNPTRDMGVSVWGNLLGDKLQYRLEIMEGRKAAAGSASVPGAPKSDFRYGGRVHVSLLDAETDYGYKGTYLGQKKVATLGAAVQVEPGAVYGDWSARTDKKDYSAWSVDGFFEYPVKDVGTFTASGAVAKFKLDHAYLGANPDPAAYGLNGEKNGGYFKAAYMLPTVPLQFFARVEQWKFAQLDGIYDQKVDWAGLGANYYIWGENLKLTFEYSTTRFDKAPTAAGAGTKDLKSFITQLQVIF